MLKKLEKIYDEKIISMFYILLPIVEVITTFMVVHINTTITLGLVYKTIFLIYALFYLVFINKNKRKSTLALLSIILVSILANLIITTSDYSIKNLFAKVAELSRYATLPIVMMFFFKYIDNGNKIHLKTLVYSATIYAVVMIIARLTGTQYATYSTSPDFGHSGWYYSGNEISALLAMFYPIIIYFAGKYRSRSMIFALSAVTYGLLAIGTKTSFFSISITLVALLLFELGRFLLTKNKLSKDMLFVVFILLIVLVASAPYSPSLKYMMDRFNNAKTNAQNIGNVEDTNKNIVESFVYNGRQLDMKDQVGKYQGSNISEKIFGLNDENRIKNENGETNLIERDFYDIFFAYGILGVLIYFFPILYIGVCFGKRLVTNFKVECNEKNFVIGISALIALGISFIAGHVLLSPTVALFLCVILAKLNMEGDFYYSDKSNSKKKIAIFLPRLSIGGMERALVNLLVMSDLKNKYSINLYIGYIKDKEYIDDLPEGINTYIFCKGKWNIFNKVITAGKMLCLNVSFVFNDNYYAAICYGHNHGILALLARTASKNNIIFIHADLENRTKSQMDKLNRQVRFERFKKVVCVSEKALRSFRNIFPKYKGVSTVINNYIDGKHILDMSLNEEDLIENINFNNTTFIHVSRQEERSKKISRIIESSRRLKSENYNFQVLLIGEGEDTESYKEKIKAYGLEDTIFMLGKKKNPYVYIKKSSALLFTSLFEGYGIVLDEARILNVPIVSTDVSDAKKMTEEGYGILCDNSEDGVYVGMRKFLDEGFKIEKEFDYNKFNNVITNKLNDIVKER